MHFFITFVAFGIAFIATRLITGAALAAISPPPPDTTPYQWWGWYASVLISIIVASWVMSIVDRRMRKR